MGEGPGVSEGRGGVHRAGRGSPCHRDRPFTEKGGPELSPPRPFHAPGS